MSKLRKALKRDHVPIDWDCYVEHGIQSNKALHIRVWQLEDSEGAGRYASLTTEWSNIIWNYIHQNNRACKQFQWQRSKPIRTDGESQKANK